MRIGSSLILICLISLTSACSDQKTDLNDFQVSISTESSPADEHAADISVTKDIVYATSTNEENTEWTLDVYTPVETGDWPIVVLLHGLGGNKNGYKRVSETISESGATVFTVTYPMKMVDIAAQQNGLGFRKIYEALACALGYARTKAMDFNSESSELILVAHSYGAYYGAWMALASENLESKWEEYAENENGPPQQISCVNNSGSLRVDGFIGIGGGRYHDAEKLSDINTALWEIVSPYLFFGNKLDMPILLLHGDQDKIANPQSSDNFNSALVEAGYDSRVIRFEGGHIVPAQLTYESVMEIADK